MVVRRTALDRGERTLPIDLVQAAVAFALRRGWDVNGILHEAGIPPLLLSQGRSRITDEQVISIVRALWRLTNDEMFGLGPQPLPRGTFRLLCHGMLNASDIGGALERFQGFAKAVPAVPPLLVTDDGDAVRIAMELGLEKPDPDHLFTISALSVTHRVMAWGIGRNVPIRWVEFPFPQPERVESLDLVFGAPLVFDAATPALVCDGALLRAPLIRNANALDEFIASSPAGLLLRHDYATSVSDSVLKLVEHGLKGRHPTGDDIASQLTMSPQSLRRKLSIEGTSLREIRDNVLRDAAVNSLVQGDETIRELSARLGFSEPSAFTRAFRRWTGSPPSAYREGAGES